MSIQLQSYKKQKLKNLEIKKHNDNVWSQIKIFTIITIVAGFSLVFIHLGPGFYVYSGHPYWDVSIRPSAKLVFLIGTISFVRLLFISSKIQSYLTNDFCPDCGSEVYQKVKSSQYINTTKKRKDGNDDLRYNKTGYTDYTYHYVCKNCDWENLNNPRPAGENI